MNFVCIALPLQNAVLIMTTLKNTVSVNTRFFWRKAEQYLKYSNYYVWRKIQYLKHSTYSWGLLAMLKTGSRGLEDEEGFSSSFAEFILVKRRRKTFSFCSQVKSRASILPTEVDLNNKFKLMHLNLII